MIVKTLLSAALGGIALWQWAGRHQHGYRQRQQQKTRTKPHEVTRWEGEGGALRTTGAQVGPAPEVP